MRIILTGNPNVGKSVVFSYLTGYSAISSNYPGTTIELLKGRTKLAGIECEVIDLPGCYSLDGESVAERIAGEIVTRKDYDVIFNVVDANNLERNLFLTLQLLEIGKPIILIITKCDIARNRGISIDFAKLESFLGVDAVGVVATAGIGFEVLESRFKRLLVKLPDYRPKIKVPTDNKDKWKMIGEISFYALKTVHKHPTLLEKLEEYTTTPSTAIPIAVGLIILSFYLIRGVAEFLINIILDPLFNNYYLAFVKYLAGYFQSGFLKDLIFAKNINPLEGFSVLTTGLYIPFVVVLPYVVSFYIVLGVLEDIGYLPRLAVILDRLSHKVGLHGYGIIPLIMGAGCKAPGIFSLRILEGQREKIIALSLMFLIIPCMPQSAMIISLLSKYHPVYTFILFIYFALVGFIASFLLNKHLKGTSDELFIEIPPYHKPVIKNLYLKLKIRIKHFLYDALPFILLGVFFINFVDILGGFDYLTFLVKPLFNLLNLPSELAGIVIFGFLKKDVSISLLVPLNLQPKEAVVMSFFLVTYLPCLSSIFVVIKEVGRRIFLYVVLFNLVVSVFFSLTLYFALKVLGL